AGRIFWGGALAHLGQAPEGLPSLLDSLEGRDLIRREPVSRYQGQQQFRFKHSLIRDVAYATLPRARRREAHAAVAAFLEEVHADRDSPAALGHHWREAGDADRAVEYFVAAAERASTGVARGRGQWPRRAPRRCRTTSTCRPRRRRRGCAPTRSPGTVPARSASTWWPRSAARPGPHRRCVR